MQTTVRFLEDEGRRLQALEVEASGRELLLAEIARVLFELRVRVFHDPPTAEASFDRLRIASAEGGRVSQERRAQVQAAVLETIHRLGGISFSALTPG